MKYQVFALYSGTRYLGEIDAETQEEAEEAAAGIAGGSDDDVTELRVQSVTSLERNLSGE